MMRIFNRNFNDKKIKKIAYTAVFMALVGWFVFRFIMVAIESRMVVFNPVRDSERNGTLVDGIIAEKQNSTINFPITVKNNRAYVSGAARAKLHPGQKISGGGVVVNVSNSLDFDSGMYIVRTNGVSDGVKNILIPCNGYFVPVYAIHNGAVFVSDSYVAREKSINVIIQDSDTACVSGNINDGDIVILSRVSDGQKISFQK